MRSWKMLPAVLLVLVSVLVTVPRSAASKQLLLVYEPYSVGADLAGLVSAAENYFETSSGNFEFQPVAEIDQLRKLLPRAGYAIMPGWTYRSLQTSYSLGPLATSVSDGSKFFEIRILTRTGEFSSVEELSGKKVATMGFGRRTADVLNRSLFTGGASASRYNIIDVSKPLDAIMAVKFGQVDAALLTSVSHELLSDKRPGLLEGLEVIGRSERLVRSTLFSVGEAKSGDVVDLFLNMSETAEGRKLLKRLQYDGWVVQNEF